MSASSEFLEVVHGRHNEMIDPTLHIWGWEIPVYLFLGGLAAGLLVLPAILEMIRGRETLPTAVRRMPFVSLILLSLGMVALFLDDEASGEFVNPIRRNGSNHFVPPPLETNTYFFDISGHQGQGGPYRGARR